MSVPLDRLYNFLHDLCDQDIIIYRWFPHGSRKLEDLHRLNQEMDWLHRRITPYMICHDQEPLQYGQYSDDYIKQEICTRWGDWITDTPAIGDWLFERGFKSLTPGVFGVYNNMLLLHSELNSPELEKYQRDGFVGVYYWSHALIARDWYRYAKHDSNQKFNPANLQYDFLIYNRAWSGTREYRLKFAELLINANLSQHCYMGFNAYDEVHYANHDFKNPRLTIQRYDLEQHFFENTTDSSASADYNNNDYNKCAIEVVLETLFDDQRLHLTEKTLRPIACGKPFVIVSSAGSLAYLRRYGFETFDGIIDESYDTIVDSVERLEAIVAELNRIANLPQEKKLETWHRMHAVAARNKERFFSNRWENNIVEEFKTNMKQALTKIECTGEPYQNFKALCTAQGVDLKNGSEKDHQRLAEFVIFNSCL